MTESGSEHRAQPNAPGVIGSGNWMSDRGKNAGVGTPTPSSWDEMTAGEVVALVVAILWVAGVGGYMIFLSGNAARAAPDDLRFVTTLIAIFMPVAMLWIAVLAARSTRVMREESHRLHAAIDGMRQTYLADRQAAASTGEPSAIERKLAEIAQSAKQTEAAVATFTSTRSKAAQPPADTPPRGSASGDDQPTLALGTPAEDMAPPMPRRDIIRALNFPDNESDRDGFSALKRALRDRALRQVIQASQDMLTLLSQDGIYMDDLRPDRSRPEVWRRFARGERGRAIAGLGGVRDRSSLALASGRMREDTVFRDSAHHFLRLFDRLLSSFEPEATDEDLVALSETRSARAFMLLGRVTGTFD